jgi:hypothetical protein
VKQDSMGRTVLTLACVAALAVALSEARAAGPSGAAPASPRNTPEPAAGPKTGEGAGAKTEPGEAAKPATTAPAAPTPPSQDSQTVTLAELTKEGFEIRTTVFVPAEAVTRQSGKVSSDAIMVTLQKTTATAVCFYTLKAYVSKKLSTIPACTVHR